MEKSAKMSGTRTYMYMYLQFHINLQLVEFVLVEMSLECQGTKNANTPPNRTPMEESKNREVSSFQGL